MFPLIPNKLLYVFLLAALALVLAAPAANAGNARTVGPVKKRTLDHHSNTVRTLYVVQGTCPDLRWSGRAAATPATARRRHRLYATHRQPARWFLWVALRAAMRPSPRMVRARPRAATTSARWLSRPAAWHDGGNGSRFHDGEV